MRYQRATQTAQGTRRAHDRARCVMVLGTTSGAGKSWLATALCRWYARRLAGRALQGAEHEQQRARGARRGRLARSARAVLSGAGRAARADVDMNPVLLKPERDTASQVVLLGRVRRPAAPAVARAQ